MYTKINNWLKSKKNGILAFAFAAILVITMVIPCGASWYDDIPNEVGRAVSGRWLFSGGEFTGYVQNRHIIEGAFAISNDSYETTNRSINDLYLVNYGDPIDDITSTAELYIDNAEQVIALNKDVPMHTIYSGGNNTERMYLYFDPFYYFFNDYDIDFDYTDNLSISFIADYSALVWDQHPSAGIHISFTVVDLLSFKDGVFDTYDVRHTVYVNDYYNATEDKYIGELDFDVIAESAIDNYGNLTLCTIENLLIDFDYDLMYSYDNFPFDYELEVDFDLEPYPETYYKSILYRLWSNEDINNFIVDVVYDNREPPPTPGAPIRPYADWIAESVSGFFSFELYPGFYLGGIIVAVIAFCLVMWWLKMFGGG